MKVTKRRLRSIIRESLQISEEKIYVTRTPYGDMYEDDEGNDIGIGEMVKTLLDAGDDDIFQAPQGVDQKSLRDLIGMAEQGVQGGVERWDPDVFRDYYNVDLDRVLRLYARKMNLSIEEVEGNY